MYVGRILAAGINSIGNPVALYRISSRSYTDRTIVVGDSRAEVASLPTVKPSDSAFIYYGCYRVAGDLAVLGNGTHTDWIADKVSMGCNPREALADTLRFMDYEHDSQSTPRLAAIVLPNQGKAFFGSVSPTDLLVWQLPLVPGEVHCIATYESMHRPDGARSGPITAVTATELAKEIYDGGWFSQFDQPVCSFATTYQGGAWSRGVTYADKQDNPE
jgi:IMP cyclohydrolase